MLKKYIHEKALEAQSVYKELESVCSDFLDKWSRYTGEDIPIYPFTMICRLSESSKAVENIAKLMNLLERWECGEDQKCATSTRFVISSSRASKLIGNYCYGEDCDKGDREEEPPGTWAELYDLANRLPLDTEGLWEEYYKPGYNIDDDFIRPLEELGLLTEDESVRLREKLSDGSLMKEYTDNC